MSDEPGTPPVEVPPWIAAEMWQWLRRFGVDEYVMKVAMGATDTDADVRVYGMANVQARYLRATLTFNTALEATDYGRHVVAHECAHVLLGEVAAVVQHLIDQLPARAQALAFEMWDDASDRTIERLVRAYMRELHEAIHERADATAQP